ncbi:hypothetical protein OH77DRAFT_1422647 [Trametes cingulata]|nr:hypothetical protein OH77DRAFT_1422647 [Trametes cingulata]
MESPSSASGGALVLSTADAKLAGNVGSLLIGTCLGVILYGLFIHQSYVFFSTGPKLRVHTSLVVVILLLETVHCALCMLATYQILLVDRPPAVKRASDSRWSLHVPSQALSLLSAIIFCFTQSLFARRVAIIWPYYGVAVAMIAGAFTAGQLGAAIGSAVLFSRRPSENVSRHIGSLRVAQSVLVIGASVVLVGALIYHLRRSRTGFARTDGIIRLVILWSGYTGLTVVVTGLLSLVFALRSPESHLREAVSIVATNLYAVSLLAESHSREPIEEGTHSSTSKHRAGPRNCQLPRYPPDIFLTRGLDRRQHMTVMSTSRRLESIPRLPTFTPQMEIMVTTEVVCAVSDHEHVKFERKATQQGSTAIDNSPCPLHVRKPESNASTSSYRGAHSNRSSVEDCRPAL